MSTRLHEMKPTQTLAKEAPSSRLNYERLIDKALDLAIEEDLGGPYGLSGIDITTQATVDSNVIATGKLYCKQPGVLAGMDIVTRVFKRFDKNIQIIKKAAEGDLIDPASVSRPVLIATIEGRAATLLSAERLALNLLQRMSGIATVTRRFVELAKPFGISILDTRKTTPGIRVFERLAVECAGGKNHRFGLFDAILIKDNHIQIAGTLSNAIAKARKLSPDLPIEVETTNLKEVEEAVSCGVRTIMLDNMSPDMVRDAVALIKKRCLIEVSGGINLNTIRDYLIPGVDAISVGALTHSASNIDMSLEIEDFRN